MIQDNAWKTDVHLLNFNTQSKAKFKSSSCIFSGPFRRLRRARENVCKQVTISSGFISDWMKNWHEVFQANHVS